MKAVQITHPDKILFPQDAFTKRDVFNYYATIAPYILPFLKKRPFVMQRFPNGIQKPGFFQKNVPDFFPPWISTTFVARKGQTKGKLVLCNTKNTLLYLVNFGCLTPHIWLSKEPNLSNPDRLIFDIDPPPNKIEEAKKTALLLKKTLQKRYQLKSFVMTTGSKGYHVVVPIKPTLSFDQARAFAKKIGSLVAKENQTLCTTSIRKTERNGKVYIDILRNSYAQHAVSPYAIRPLPSAPIAMPISWKDLPTTDPQSFTLSNYQKAPKNPWKGFSRNQNLNHETDPPL